MQASHLNQIAAFARGLTLHIEKALQASFNRSLSELTALVSIQNCEQFHIGWLAETLSVEHSSAVRVVDRLERDGLISRLAKDSQKKVGLKTTESGSTLAKSVLAIREQATKSYLAPLGMKQQGDLAKILQLVIKTQTRTEVDLYRHCALCNESICANCVAGSGLSELLAR